MKESPIELFWMKTVVIIYVTTLCVTSLMAGEPDPVPPDQDYYLHFSQYPNFCCGGDPLTNGSHELVLLENPLPGMEPRPPDGSWTDQLTIEAWVLWESSDLEEIQAATGVVMDRMTLMCANTAYGFQYGSNGSEGWTFFLQTAEQSYPDTGTIPLPRGEWVHLAASYDGSIIKTFLNGVKQTETPATGGVLFSGNDEAEPDPAFTSQCRWAEFRGGEITYPSQHLAIGVGTGFTGGMRQLRLWNRALSEVELAANASLHLQGNEPGLVGYWPMDNPFTDAYNSGVLHRGKFSDVTNKVSADHPLYINTGIARYGASWRMTQPVFAVREDLAEDVLVSDCASMPVGGFQDSSLIDIQNDDDLDLIIAGSAESESSCQGDILSSVEAMIRDGENGFVFGTQAAFAGVVPLTLASGRHVSGDFNGDGQSDLFIANLGIDFCVTDGNTVPDAGAPNTLFLSRPDGRLEDSSANLLGAPCTADEPQFEGQRPCYAGGDYGGRTPGIRFPAAAEPVPLTNVRDSTHGVAVGDIDGDGDLDIAVDNLAQTGLATSYMLINDGQGRFTADWERLPDVVYGEIQIPILPRVDIEAVPLNYLLTDLDGDDHVDLVTAPDDSGSLQEWATGISWNDGSGDFSDVAIMIIEPTDGIPGIGGDSQVTSGAMVATDIDNDGDKDLLISWNTIDWWIQPESLQILVNKGGRVFADESVARIGAPPQVGLPRLSETRFYAEDVNNDGCVDILFTGDIPLQPLDAGIWLNDCYGNFSPRWASTFTKQDGVSFPLDYDGDGDIDYLNMRSRPVRYAGTEGCAENESGGTDYYDFAVILNERPYKSPRIFKDGFEKK